MKESEFQGRVVAVAEAFGWQVWHVPAPMRVGRGGKWVGAKEGAGLPDLILMHDDPPRLVFLELKQTGGKLADNQKHFLQMARAIAEESWTAPTGLTGNAEHTIGVFAVWPEHEEQIERMLRTRQVG